MNDLNEISNETREHGNNSNRDDNQCSWPLHWHSSPTISNIANAMQWCRETEKETKIKISVTFIIIIIKVSGLRLKEMTISTLLHGMGRGGRLSSFFPVAICCCHIYVFLALKKYNNNNSGSKDSVFLIGGLHLKLFSVWLRDWPKSFQWGDRSSGFN